MTSGTLKMSDSYINMLVNLQESIFSAAQLKSF